VVAVAWGIGHRVGSALVAAGNTDIRVLTSSEQHFFPRFDDLEHKALDVMSKWFDLLNGRLQSHDGDT